MHERAAPPHPIPNKPLGSLRRTVRRLGVLLIGVSVFSLGLLISPLPGPGFTILGPLGLAILATEFAWAANLLRGFKDGTRGFRAHIDRLAMASPLWAVVACVVLYWTGAVLAALYTPVPQVAVWITASIMFAPIGYWAWVAFRRRTGHGGRPQRPRTGQPGRPTAYTPADPLVGE
jgi:small-conductance mechanosensitive channel